MNLDPILNVMSALLLLVLAIVIIFDTIRKKQFSPIFMITIALILIINALNFFWKAKG